MKKIIIQSAVLLIHITFFLFGSGPKVNTYLLRITNGSIIGWLQRVTRRTNKLSLWVMKVCWWLDHLGCKSHPVVIVLTFQTCSKLLQLLIVCQMNEFRELAEAAYVNSGRGELQQWTPFTVFLVGLYIWVTEEKRRKKQWKTHSDLCYVCVRL